MGIFSYQKKRKNKQTTKALLYFSLPEVKKRWNGAEKVKNAQTILAAQSTETVLNVSNELIDTSKRCKDNFSENEN